jgi:hypothetical protein
MRALTDRKAGHHTPRRRHLDTRADRRLHLQVDPCLRPRPEQCGASSNDRAPRGRRRIGSNPISIDGMRQRLRARERDFPSRSDHPPSKARPRQQTADDDSWARDHAKNGARQQRPSPPPAARSNPAADPSRTSALTAETTTRSPGKHPSSQRAATPQREIKIRHQKTPPTPADPTPKPQENRSDRSE